jgi:hypothetical protein
MGQQYNKVIKRRRRKEYLKRVKDREKTNQAVAKKAPGSKSVTAEESDAELKKAAAKKVPASKKVPAPKKTATAKKTPATKKAKTDEALDAPAGEASEPQVEATSEATSEEAPTEES